MTLSELLYQTKMRFEKIGIDTAYLDAQVLYCHAAGLSREQAYMVLKDPVNDQALPLFEEYVAKRLSGYPVSYIRKEKEFFGRTFFVDERVLVPRPDTEILVEHTLELIKQNDFTEILDICTGSGCIPITLAKEQELRNHPISVSCSDISDGALEVCRKNARSILGRELPTVRSDLFENINGNYQIITANPPYIATMDYQKMQENDWPEPEVALHSGVDGLDCIQRLVPESLDYLLPKGYLLIEAAPWQAEKVREIMISHGFDDVFTIRDMGSRERITVGKK